MSLIVRSIVGTKKNHCRINLYISRTVVHIVYSQNNLFWSVWLLLITVPFINSISNHIKNKKQILHGHNSRSFSCTSSTHKADCLGFMWFIESDELQDAYFLPFQGFCDYWILDSSALPESSCVYVQFKYDEIYIKILFGSLKRGKEIVQIMQVVPRVFKSLACLHKIIVHIKK